ncbi:MAG: hypothetical protein HDR09_14500 [Lachnospiraceae bacterium]|nr:hypothetical protein [Lachnospiraceae bacterium]
MRNSIKITILMGVLILSMFSISACGQKVADEEQIKQELEEDSKFQFLRGDEQIEEVVIEKRQTVKEQKTDTVWCTVTTSNTEASCQKNVILSYGLYDKTGWLLDDIEVESKDKWIMTPLKGIEESNLSALLSGQVLVIDEEEWPIAQENLLSVKIEEQQTNLEQRTDQVTISLKLDDKLVRAEGKIEVLFTFDQEWEFDSIISKEDLTVSMKEEYVINVSEDDLMAKVLESELPVGETKQTISVGEQEISNFKIEEQKSEAKGSRQVYRCSYHVNKPQVTLAAESQVVYEYQEGEGWKSAKSSATSQIESTSIAGNWSGTYRDVFSKKKAELDIIEVQDDGTVSAVYTFDEGSYELSGTWNRESLELWLEAGDWIVEPSKIRISNDKEDIIGELKLEKDRLEANTRQGFIYFKVTEN